MKVIWCHQEVPWKKDLSLLLFSSGWQSDNIDYLHPFWKSVYIILAYDKKKK